MVTLSVTNTLDTFTTDMYTTITLTPDAIGNYLVMQFPNFDSFIPKGEGERMEAAKSRMNRVQVVVHTSNGYDLDPVYIFYYNDFQLTSLSTNIVTEDGKT